MHHFNIMLQICSYVFPTRRTRHTHYRPKKSRCQTPTTHTKHHK